MINEAATPEKSANTRDAGVSDDSHPDNLEALKAKVRECLGEIRGLKDKNNGLTARLESYEVETKKQKDATLAEQGKWKDIAENKDKELTKAKTDAKSFRTMAAAIKAGMVEDADAINMFVGNVSDDFSNIAEVIADQKKNRPYLFPAQAPEQKPGVNKGLAPVIRTGTPQAISQAQIDNVNQAYIQRKISHADYQKFMSDVEKAKALSL